MRYGLDTNVLVYAEDYKAARKCDLSLALLNSLSAEDVCIPVQTLGELHRVLVGKAGRSEQASRDRVLQYLDAFSTAPTTTSAFQSALELSVTHRFSIWDSIVMAVCAENGCRLLFTEDLQEGFTWNGLTVVNPYLKTHAPEILALLPERL
jgi:predicted nucleic acid-binding protein